MTPDPKANLSDAIALMSAWLTYDAQSSAPKIDADEILRTLVADGDDIDRLTDVIAGLISVGGVLLQSLSRASGVPPETLLQRVALKNTRPEIG